MLPFLNIAFFVFHTALLVFNLTGWACKRTRRLHAIALGVTLFSWIVLGPWLGWGYCVCTDWHWQVRRAMGISDPEGSYTQFLARAITGMEIGRVAMDWITGLAVAFAVAMNALMTARERRRI
ncbi:MAG: DUF2784 domain-containing protein [Armatimonadetes bacterium]|nr:DUF2784 domain-containing protein [Armatimonadota bacterium]